MSYEIVNPLAIDDLVFESSGDDAGRRVREILRARRSPREWAGFQITERDTGSYIVEADSKIGFLYVAAGAALHIPGDYLLTGHAGEDLERIDRVCRFVECLADGANIHWTRVAMSDVVIDVSTSGIDGACAAARRCCDALRTVLEERAGT